MNSYISNLADYSLAETYIMHIPHSSSIIPHYNYYTLPKDNVLEEHQLLTDLGTDLLFKTPFTSLIFPYSRVFCDVERFPDEKEDMFLKGRGFYYTHTDQGKELRTLEGKKEVKTIYENWHHKLESTIEDKLNKYEMATIIDCHSFSDTPFISDFDQNKNRPDFCLGTDDFHTPDYLLKFIKRRLENEGYSVSINTPYSGTIVPIKYYQQNQNVHSIMIEINRRLFQEGNTLIDNKVKQLNQIINHILLYEEYTL